MTECSPNRLECRRRRHVSFGRLEIVPDSNHFVRRWTRRHGVRLPHPCVPTMYSSSSLNPPEVRKRRPRGPRTRRLASATRRRVWSTPAAKHRRNRPDDDEYARRHRQGPRVARRRLCFGEIGRVEDFCSMVSDSITSLELMTVINYNVFSNIGQVTYDDGNVEQLPQTQLAS